jgi:hypothetical protein
MTRLASLGDRLRRRIRRLRPVELATLGLAVAVLAFWFYQYLHWYGSVPVDATTYIKAGERLNAGHVLYALSPGDRDVPLYPPYWTVPLLSPPLIAVIFRPLAMLPNDAGINVWWAITMTAVIGTLVALANRRPIATAWTAIALSLPITFEMGVANVNSLLLMGAVLSWWLFVRGRHRWAGAVVAAMIAVKLTPAPFAIWLLLGRRSRRPAFIGLAVSTLVWLAVSVGGAGLSAHFDYLGVIRNTQEVGTNGFSLAGVGRFVGIAPEFARWLPDVALLVCLSVMFAWRERPARCYSVAVVAWLVASPVVDFNTFMLLLPLLAPLAWPAEETTEAAESARPNARASASA